MSKYQQHESARLITEAQTLETQYAKLAVEEMRTRLAMRRIETQLENLDHTFGTLNPGQRIGWGVPS